MHKVSWDFYQQVQVSDRVRSYRTAAGSERHLLQALSARVHSCAIPADIIWQGVRYSSLEPHIYGTVWHYDQL